MTKYLSGRVPRTPQTALTTDRYGTNAFLGLNQAEPNLGDPSASLITIPAGQQYQVVSVVGYPGERYWVPTSGLIPGSISVFEESVLVGSLSSITQLNFIGNSITATAVTYGIIATITVAPPGNNGSVLFKESGDFATSSGLVFNSSVGILTIGTGLRVGTGQTFFNVNSNGFVGIGTSNPTQMLDLTGNLRLRGTIYDYTNNPGTTNQILVKNSFGGLTWVNQSTITAGAGGTYQNVQFNNSAGLVDGAPTFVYDEINQRVGIGSTRPRVTLDVLGISSFRGGVTIDNLNVLGVTTTSTLAVSGTTTTGNLLVSGISTLGFLTGTNAYFTGIITASKVVAAVDVVNLYVSGLSTFIGLATFSNGLQVVSGSTILGLTSATSLFAQTLSVSGVSTFVGIATFNDNLNVSKQTTLGNLRVSGVSTTGNIKVDTNTVSTLTGNLILDSLAGTTQINDAVYVNDTTESVDKDTGAIIVEGGVGIEKRLNVGGGASITGVSTFGSNVLPFTTGTQNLGSASQKWNSVYANTFNGQFVGTADVAGYALTAGIATNATYAVTAGIATKATYADNAGISTILKNARTIAITGDLIYTSAGFDGSSNVTGVGILTTSGVTAGTYGSGTQVGILTVDSKGRITAATNVNIDFGGATVAAAGRLSTARSISAIGDISWGVTFDGSANVAAAATLSNTGVTSATYGSSTQVPVFAVDTKGRISSVTNTLINFAGATVAQADKLTNARNIAIVGDLSWNVNFDGSANVGATGILANTGVTSATYGSSSSIPIISVDSKGRITSVTNTGINFATATVSQSDTTKTINTSLNLNYYPTFVASNSIAGLYQDFYTGDGIVFNPNTSSLGIGNSSPSDNLHLQGIFRIDRNLTAQDQTYIRYFRQGNEKARFGLLANDTSIFFNATNSNTANHLIINSSGNIGIGTSIASTKLFVAGGAYIAGVSTLAGNVITYGNVTPSQDNTYTLGTNLLRWSNIYSNNFTGNFTGNADTATTAGRLSTARTISATGDLAWGVIFDGSGNVSAAATLANTGVSAGTYGSSTQVGILTVDSKGRITAATNVNIDFSNAVVASANKLTNARNIAITGDLAWNVNFDGTTNVTSTGTLANTGVIAGTYGSATQVGILTVDSKGRVTAASNVNINFSNATVASADKLTTARNIAVTGDLAWNVNFDGTTNVSGIGTLANSGVTAGTYGSATQVGILTVDSKGRITAATNTSINFSGATVAQADKLTNSRSIAIIGDIAWSVNFDGSANVSGLGTLSNTGVTSATYGSSTSIPVISVDAKGRISSVTTQGVNFSSATVNATDNIKTSTASTDTSYYPTFVYQNSGGAYQSLYTDGGITYNPSTDTLTAGRGLFTANLSVDTAGAATTTSTIVFKRSGQSITSFGSYAGAWRSALQLQNNDSTRLLFFAPPEQDYQFGIIRAVNGGLKIDVGGNSSNTGVNAISIDTTGAVSFPQGVTGTISGNIASADKLSTARNIAAIGDISWGVIFDGSVNVSAGATLSNTGVTSSTYGSSTLIPVFSVDSKGRITSVTNTGISFGSATVASADKLTTARNIAITGDLAWNVNFDGSANVTSTGTLANSGVTAGTYGSSTLVPVITVDAKGRVTSVTNTGVNFSASTVASADKLTTARNIAITGDLAWNVNFDGSANVTSTGTLANSGVTAGTYGSTTTIPVFAVDAKGRVTSVTNTAINFSSGATNVTVTQAGYACANPISVIGAGGISIGSTSNAYGTRYIQATAPSSPCDGDIWYDTTLGSSIVPIGSVFYFAASSAPTGYLSCNGAAISRTTYSALFAIISTTYGSGDGSTTFNLPDLRGEFIRGWDNGRGVDSGRTMGSSQSHAIASHDHNFRNFYFAENNGNSGLGNGYAGSRQGNDFDNNPFYIDWTTYGNNGAGTETRPRNVALLPCIRY